VSNPSKTFAIDLAERTVATFLQGATGAAAVVLVGSNTQNVVHLSIYQQAGAAALAGGVSAVAALLKGVAAGLKTGTASASKTVSESAVVLTLGAHSDASAESPVPSNGDSEIYPPVVGG
jgi:hypothetical protein